MKKLILIRHAKSSWDLPHLSDFDRPLNNRGEKDAPRMGKRIKDMGIHPDILLTSLAARALATCEIIASILKFPKDKIKTSRNLYHADEDEFLNVIRQLPDLPDDEEVVMVFGHNPGLTEFTNSLLNEDFSNIPTCGVVGSTLNIKHWKDAAWGCGELDFFDYPKRKE